MKSRMAGWLAAGFLALAGCSGDGADAGVDIPDTSAEDAATPDTDDGVDTADWCEGPEDCDPATPVCDPGTGACVACLFDRDCTPEERCVDLTCEDASICDEPGVDCDAAAKPPCDGEGCLPCEADSWCPGIYHCDDGRCVLDRCHRDEGACTEDGLIACNDRGTGWDPATPCPAKHTCDQDGWEALCAEWVCEPGGTCLGDELIVCSEDGLRRLETVDCAADGALCIDGECKAILCEPGEAFCDEEDLSRYHKCNDDGTAASSFDCPAGVMFCLSGECVPLACEPGEPTCNFNNVATCGEFGSGPIDEGTPCPEGERCLKGSCEDVICEPGTYECAEDGSALLKCGSTGTSWNVEVPCSPPTTTCQDGDDGPGCSGQ